MTEVQPHLRVELLHADEVDGLEAVTVRGDEVEASVNSAVGDWDPVYSRLGVHELLVLSLDVVHDLGRKI